ncbi:hypothetical protein SAMN05421690_100422 [Nitrosomonas sp. Nm51]|uniref:tetratricopeptide repeat protein n=1 Tax=Nitrosomonas sp. Nm51 TaxID=133720 RepID=UPI0008BEBA82|nr:tetratricopeptide repeat protein [Nitrosomonas sp. Nm51]SEQ94513.1 hypothetical protein SAMN05421690_100422 [Nitrosomonas sp. Nm51]
MLQASKKTFFWNSVLKVFVGFLWLPALFAQHPPDAHTELAKAQQWLAEGKYNSAYQVFLSHAQHYNSALAQFTLGLFHQYGWGITIDPKTACHWHHKAAKADIPAASHFLAECLQHGTHQPVDYTAALHWYRRAAELGHYISLCSIAELIMQGKGTEKNPRHALDQCRQAALAGSAPAQLKMGEFYLSGDESIRDIHQAIVWFNYAAESGSVEACYHLGNVYLNYLDHHVMALNWFETAASRGFLPAYLPTAQLYFNAPVSEETQMPTAENLAKAYLWLSTADQVSENENELNKIARMLKKVEQIMPKNWKKDLDQKINQHLSAFHP